MMREGMKNCWRVLIWCCFNRVEVYEEGKGWKLER